MLCVLDESTRSCSAGALEPCGTCFSRAATYPCPKWTWNTRRPAWNSWSLSALVGCTSASRGTSAVEGIAGELAGRITGEMFIGVPLCGEGSGTVRARQVQLRERGACIGTRWMGGERGSSQQPGAAGGCTGSRLRAAIAHPAEPPAEMRAFFSARSCVASNESRREPSRDPPVERLREVESLDVFLCAPSLWLLRGASGWPEDPSSRSIENCRSLCGPGAGPSRGEGPAIDRIGGLGAGAGICSADDDEEAFGALLMRRPAFPPTFQTVSSTGRLFFTAGASFGWVTCT